MREFVNEETGNRKAQFSSWTLTTIVSGQRKAMTELFRPRYQFSGGVPRPTKAAPRWLWSTAG